MQGPVTARHAHEPDWGRVRVLLRRILIAVIVLFGTVLLVRDARSIRLAIVAIAQANPLLALATGALAGCTYLGAAIAMRAASGRDLPLGRTTAAQLAAACTNRIAPAGLGGMATNLRYLEREGASRSEAVAAIGLTSVASFLVHAVLTAVALLVVGLPASGLPSLPVSDPTALAIGAGVALVAFGLARRLPERTRASIRDAAASVGSVSLSPRRLGFLMLGTLAVTLGHGLAFVTATAALGVRVPVLGTLAVFLTGSALAAAAPTPGGLGPLEAALAAGLTGLGAATTPAIAAVLTFRLITYWLPVVPGAMALELLRREPRDAVRGAPRIGDPSVVPGLGRRRLATVA